jgi:hypothetical protein
MPIRLQKTCVYRGFCQALVGSCSSCKECIPLTGYCLDLIVLRSLGRFQPSLRNGAQQLGQSEEDSGRGCEGERAADALPRDDGSCAIRPSPWSIRRSPQRVCATGHDGVIGMAGGAIVDRRAAVAGVLSDMRSGLRSRNAAVNAAAS